MRKILILMGRYLPGYKDGGPLRTIANVTEALGDEYEFYIAALDRDHGDVSPYPGISYNAWNPVGKAKVWYVKPGGFSLGLIRRLAKDMDLVYSCGFYDDYGYNALLLNRLQLLHGKPLVVASMGTFSPGALAQKAWKKRIFIGLMNLAGLFKGIRWSVTSHREEAELREHIKGDPECVVAEDLPRFHVPGCAKTPDETEKLRVVFLSRICAMKNLIGTIEILKNITQSVEFSIYGPKEDEEYWLKCVDALEALPEHVHWAYKGSVLTEDVQKVFQAHDVFLFPTLGENYGHVIFEALSAGCIPVISDQTPWGMIAENGGGYVLPLSDDLAAFGKIIDELSKMDGQRRMNIADRAVKIAREKVENLKKETGYRNIFGKK